jgi:chlorobactene glucosyltransferase
MSPWFWILALPLLTFLAIAGVNHFSLLRLGGSPSTRRPMVSILIPARDEARHIGRAVAALRAQTYAEREIIVLDDASSDGTADIAEEAACGDPDIRVIRGMALPTGWLGKNWACHQLAMAAAGEILLFADADVRWQPDAVAALVRTLEVSKADLLSVWPTQTTVSWAERLTVPLMALTVLGYLPLPLAYHTPWSLLAAANGQCLAFRRGAYEKSGGHEGVRDEVLEDVMLARRIKRAGLRLRLADGAGLIGCRMYDGWDAVRQGFGKNILAGYAGRVSFLVLATVFHWALFVAPWLWLLVALLVPEAGGALAPAVLIALGVAARALTAALSGQRLRDAVLMPLSVVLMTGVSAQALWWHWRGGPIWKGRQATTRPAGGSP